MTGRPRMLADMTQPEAAAVLAHDSDLVHLDRLSGGDPVESGTEGHALFRRRDVYPLLSDFRPLLSDFRAVAPSGWYGSPGSVTPERAEEIMEAVADHIVASLDEVWKGLAERRPEDLG